MSIVWYFVALAVLIALSAFFSASEMSYSSANRLRLENAAEDGSRRARTAVGILDHFDRTLSAILIGNNLVNIAASSLGSVIVILLAGEQWTWVSTVVLTLLVIIFGETMPKIVAKQNANGIALRNAYVIRALSVILYPVIWLVVGLVHLITRPLHGDTGDGDPEEAASQELQSIIETAEDEDVLDEDRSELLRSALDFSDISASEAMTARVDMVAIDIDDDWDEIVRIIDDSSYSRLPVYSGSVDNIIGFLYLNRFFKAMMDGRAGTICARSSSRRASSTRPRACPTCWQSSAASRSTSPSSRTSSAARSASSRWRTCSRSSSATSGTRPTWWKTRSSRGPTAAMSSTAP